MQYDQCGISRMLYLRCMCVQCQLQCVPAMVNSHVGHEIEKEKYVKRHKELLFGL